MRLRAAPSAKPDGDFPLAPGRPREQEVRDVRTCNHEHEPDDPGKKRQEQDNSPAARGPEAGARGREQRHGRRTVRIRKGELELAGARPERRLGLLDAHAGLEARHHEEPARVPPLQESAPAERRDLFERIERKPELWRRAPIEGNPAISARRYTNDRARPPPDPHRATDDAGFRAEQPSPQAVTDDDAWSTCSSSFEAAA